MRKRLLIVVMVVAGCASRSLIRRVQHFRDAQRRGDLVTAQTFIAPGARMWFEDKKGEGEAYVLGGGRWDHWDKYFHSENQLTDWRTAGRSVTATAHETNDFMRMLDWHAPPYTMTWTFDKSNRITEVLIKSVPEKTTSRLAEFKAWAREHHPDELRYLMPNDRLDPTGDRPERWRAVLEEWRYGTKR